MAPAGRQNSILAPVIPLADAPGAGEAWDRPRRTIYLWAVVELLLVTNSWQISSGLRVWALRRFGASIGARVTFRPRTRVKFPWKLVVGDDCWIGEGVWFHNQATITIEHDVVISQETFLTTGSHAYTTDMALVLSPIHVEAGVWITSRCIILSGVRIGRSAMIKAGSVISRDVSPNTITDGCSSDSRPDRIRFAD
jgi:putative colanic acid biosynthesis acetyltransferase WcaF